MSLHHKHLAGLHPVSIQVLYRLTPCLTSHHKTKSEIINYLALFSSIPVAKLYSYSTSYRWALKKTTVIVKSFAQLIRQIVFVSLIYQFIMISILAHMCNVTALYYVCGRFAQLGIHVTIWKMLSVLKHASPLTSRQPCPQRIHSCMCNLKVKGESSSPVQQINMPVFPTSL